jgi:phosphomannomutase
MNRFIFDVDGTLTPSRGIMDSQFQHWFNNFCRANPVYLVTGSDKPKTVEQIGEDTYNLCHTVYNCNGNDVWQSKKNIRTNEWTLPEDAHNFLSGILTKSTFPLRTGLHFEHRPGMVNFSIVGRNADKLERAKYVTWDKEYSERENIASWFNAIFPDLEAKVGGETGIDISPKGSDKSQILVDFDYNDTIHFFGDRIDEQGNDWPLANANTQGKNYHVTGWEHTWKLLKEIA